MYRGSLTLFHLVSCFPGDACSTGLPSFSKGNSFLASSNNGLIPCFVRCISMHSLYCVQKSSHSLCNPSPFKNFSEYHVLKQVSYFCFKLLHSGAKDVDMRFPIIPLFFAHLLLPCQSCGACTIGLSSSICTLLLSGRVPFHPPPFSPVLQRRSTRGAATFVNFVQQGFCRKRDASHVGKPKKRRRRAFYPFTNVLCLHPLILKPRFLCLARAALVNIHTPGTQLGLSI